MPFPDSKSADLRLLHVETPLTPEDIRDLLPWMRTMSNVSRDRLQTELSLLQLDALIRQQQLAARQIDSFDAFDKSTAKANKWMLVFTAAVTFMTLVLVAIAVIPLAY
jgi:hypothetical protein